MSKINILRIRGELTNIKEIEVGTAMTTDGDKAYAIKINGDIIVSDLTGDCMWQQFEPSNDMFPKVLALLRTMKPITSKEHFSAYQMEDILFIEHKHIASTVMIYSIRMN